MYPHADDHSLIAPPAVASAPRRIAAAAPRVLVVGDAVVDCWLTGPARRLARDAAVPVVELRDTEYAPGGAAHLAANLAALGGSVSLITPFGDDREGVELRDALTQADVDTAACPVEPGRATTVKRRLVAGDQVVARFDVAATGAPQPATVAALVDGLDAALDAGPDAVVVADYGLDAVPDAVRGRLAARRGGIPLLVVDAHEPAGWASLCPDVVTPSLAEAAGALGEAAPDVLRHAWAVARRDALARVLGAATVLLTLDRDGAVALPAGDGAVAARPAAAPAPDSHACGAGDTFTAAATLALCAGADPREALALAQSAADVVVTRPGTTVCDTAALTARLAHAARGTVLDHDDLAATIGEHRRAGHRVVFTNGCFDVLHRGHVAYLRQAKALGDVLVVALNGDAGVERLKGPGRPVNPLADRAGVVGALDAVDLVTSFDEDSPVALLERLRPDVYAKGGDYTPQMLAESPVVERLGGCVRVLAYLSDHSTSAIVERIRTEQQDVPS